MEQRRYAVGQKWAFRCSVPEFEHEMVIAHVLPKASSAMPWQPIPENPYMVHIRWAVPADEQAVNLCVTEEFLNGHVTELVADNVQLPEWWPSGKPVPPGEPVHWASMSCEGSIDEPLRILADRQHRLDEGRQRSAAAPSLEDVRRLLAPWYAQHTRKAWRPVTASGEGSRMTSRFGGTPWLDQSEPWPTCPGCDRPMQFVFQLNLDQLPDPALRDQFGSGLLQVFLCTDYLTRWTKPIWSDLGPECTLAPYQPLRGADLARIVHPSGPGNTAATRPGGEELTQPKLIASWEPIDDLPDPVDQEEQGLLYDYDFERQIVTLRCPSAGLTVENLPMEGTLKALADAYSGDKLAGWPDWYQRSDYPRCPKCGREMQFVFQIESYLRVLLDDSGNRGFVTQCPDHREVVAFGLQRD